MNFFDKLSRINKDKMSSTTITATTAINGDEILKCVEFTYKSYDNVDCKEFNINNTQEFDVSCIKACIEKLKINNREVFYLNNILIENNGSTVHTQLFVCENDEVLKSILNLVDALYKTLISKHPLLKPALEVDTKEYTFDYINVIIINEFLRQYTNQLAFNEPKYGLLNRIFYFTNDESAKIDNEYNLFEDKKYINTDLKDKKLYNLLTYIANHINNGPIIFKLFSHYLLHKQNKTFEVYFNIEDCNKTINLNEKLERIFKAVKEIEICLNNVLKLQHNNELAKVTPIIYTTENVYKNSWTVIETKCILLVEVKNQFKVENKSAVLKNISKAVINSAGSNDTDNSKLVKEIIRFIKDDTCNFNLISCNQYYLYSLIQQIVALTINHVNPNDESNDKASVLLYTSYKAPNNIVVNLNNINDMAVYIGELITLKKYIDMNNIICNANHTAIMTNMLSTCTKNDYNWNSVNKIPQSITTGLYSKSVLDKENGYSLLVLELEFLAGYNNIGDKNAIIKDYFNRVLHKSTAFQYDYIEVTKSNKQNIVLIVMINEKFIANIKTELIDIFAKKCLNKCKMQQMFKANTASEKMKNDMNGVKIYLNNMFLYFGNNDKIKYSIYNNKQFIEN